jgi:putative oxidoreductase
VSEELIITRPQTATGWRRNVLWGVKIMVALAFLAAGGAKLAGIQAMIDLFNVIGLGQGFRFVTGAVEVTGAILMLIPALAAFGALLLACTMVGAVITHLTVLPASPIPALILLVVSAGIAWAHRDQVSKLLSQGHAGGRK